MDSNISFLLFGFWGLISNFQLDIIFYMYLKSFHFYKRMQFALLPFPPSYWFAPTSKLNFPISNIEITSGFYALGLEQYYKHISM